MQPDFAVLMPDQPVFYGRRAPAGPMRDAIRRQIPELGTQGLGRRLRLWFSDKFTPEMAANHTADRVIGQLGYRHPDGWFGTVAISMEEEDDSGTIPPLLRGLPEIIDLHAQGPRPLVG